MKFLFAVGLLVFLLGFLMILLSAFRRHFMWGISLVVLPVIYPIYASINWFESQTRNGLLLSIIGFFVAVIAFYGGASNDVLELSHKLTSQPVHAEVTKLMTNVPSAVPPNEPLPNAAQASKVSLPEGETYNPLAGEDFSTPLPVEPLPPKEDVKVSAQSVPKLKYRLKPIPLNDIAGRDGQTIRIQTKQGHEQEGRLISSDDTSLSIEMPYESGLVAFQYNFADIAAVSVYDVVHSTNSTSSTVPNQ
jgi:hypothetical protein